MYFKPFGSRPIPMVVASTIVPPPEDLYWEASFMATSLSNNVKLAIQLNLDGDYIPSFNKDNNHLSFSKMEKFLCT